MDLDQAPIDGLDIRLPAHCHVPGEFALKHLKNSPDAFGSVGCQPPDHRAAYQNRPCAKRKSLQNVRASSKAPIDQDGGFRPAASTMEGSISIGSAKPVVNIAPWLDTTIPSTPCFAASCASSGTR